MNFNFLKSLPGLKVTGYSPVKSAKDFDKILLRSKIKNIIDTIQAQNKLLKTAKIHGTPLPEGITDPSVTTESLFPAYKKYISEKAYEPKSKWLTSTVYPAVIGSGLAQLAVKGLESKKMLPSFFEKNKWGIVGLLGASAGTIGAMMKIQDDTKINTARTLVQQKDVDKAVLINLLKRRKLSPQKPAGYEFYDNPTLKNLGKTPAVKEIVDTVGLPTN